MAEDIRIEDVLGLCTAADTCSLDSVCVVSERDLEISRLLTVLHRSSPFVLVLFDNGQQVPTHSDNLQRDWTPRLGMRIYSAWRVRARKGKLRDMCLPLATNIHNAAAGAYGLVKLLRARSQSVI